MKKSDLERKFGELLERRREAMLQALRDGEKPSALMFYGNICGLADAMRAVELVDWEQAHSIRDQAWALYKRGGADAEDEACEIPGQTAPGRPDGRTGDRGRRGGSADSSFFDHAGQQPMVRQDLRAAGL